MKRTYLILSILLFITTSVHAQQNTIIGTWQLDLTESIALMDNNTRQKFDGLDQSVKARIETSMSDRTFIVASNGDLTVHWKAQDSPRTSSGTWQTSGETLTITLDGDAQQYSYELITGNHLILRNTIPSGLFSNLYLTLQP